MTAVVLFPIIANYNGIYEVQNALASTFEITATFVATETGNLQKGSNITANHRGAYRIEWSGSASSVSVNQEFEFASFNGTDYIKGSKLTRKFSTGGDVGIGSGTSVVSLERGDKVWFGIRNITSAGDLDITDGAMNINKIN